MNEKALDRGMKKSFVKDQRFLLALVIIGIVVVVSVINPKFIDIKNIVAIFQQISVTGILTMAMALLLISGGIDLSIGYIMVLTEIVMATIITQTGNVSAALCAGLGTAVACGFANGIIIAKSKCIPLIITLGMGQIFYGISLIICGGGFLDFGKQFDFLKKIQIGNVVPLMLFVLVAVIVVAYVLLNRTKFGRRIVAIGGNEKNAFLSGINVDFYKIMTYVISGIFIFAAAIVAASRTNSVAASSATTGYELDALTAAIIGGVTFEGGRGTISGAFLGCLLIGVVSNAMNLMKVDPYIQIIVTGAIIVVAVVLSNLNNIRKK